MPDNGLYVIYALELVVDVGIRGQVLKCSIWPLENENARFQDLTPIRVHGDERRRSGRVHQDVSMNHVNWGGLLRVVRLRTVPDEARLRSRGQRH